MDPIAVRTRMVDSQLRARGIRDERVIHAFLSVPRHLFVEPAMHGSAYGDYALPIGQGQTISQPYMVALMTEAVQPAPEDRILEIGTGSGYQAAILASLARTVFTVERIPSLAQRAQRILIEIGVKNVIQKVGDGSSGWKQFAPYDGIVVTAGAPHVPDSLREQLADGGRLVVPVGDPGNQVLRIIERRGESYAQEDGCLCSFVPLIGREGWPSPVGGSKE
jgi:protein-L-isoaspartate(D-aspartate) O-methyltransferase